MLNIEFVSMTYTYGGMTTGLILLTPELAVELLENNYHNQRAQRQNNIQKMASDIKDGRWNPFCGSIKIDELGRLVDGQHRCKAVILADKSVIVECVLNFPIKDLALLDAGKSRSGADALKMIGAKCGTVVAAFIKFRNNFHKYGLVPKIFKINLSNAEIVDSYSQEDNEIVRKANVLASQLNGGSPAAYALFIYLANSVDAEMSDLFYELLIDDETSMHNKLRSRIIDERIKNRGADAETTFRLITKVWNAYLLGEKLKIIKINRNLKLKMLGVNAPIGGDVLSESQY